MVEKETVRAYGRTLVLHEVPGGWVFCNHRLMNLQTGGLVLGYDVRNGRYYSPYGCKDGKI